MPKDATGGKADWSPGHEIEIKFKTTRDGLERALVSPLLLPAAPPRRHNLRTIHYDTRSGGLRKAQMVLRVRKAAGAVPLLGIKSLGAEQGHPFKRREIEVRSPRGRADPRLFDAETAALVSKAAGGEALEPRFEIHTKRRTLQIRHGGSDIEVAFDGCVILAGGRTEPLFEVELELKSGQVIDLCAFALTLAADLPLALDFLSKSEKGYRLAEGRPAEPVKAAPVLLDPGTKLDGAIHAIVSNTLEHFVANWAALRERDDPDAIHQLRVALRRMRSALKMFATHLPQPDCETLRDGARRIAAGLAPARDCDVFRAGIEQGPAAERPGLFDGLLACVEERRQSAYPRARSLIDESPATIFVLKVQAFLAEPAWRNAARHIAIKHFARKALNKLHRRALERGAGLPALPDQGLHELRISLKALRYGLEFVGGVFGRKGARNDYTGAVSELQELLGTHNDEVTARRLLEDPMMRDAPAADFLLGWYARGAAGTGRSLVKAWKKFRRAEPFWT